jgi:hypothetical protein
MLNGATIHGKIAEGGVVSKMLAAGRTPEEVITALYVRAMTRKPTSAELQQLLEIVQQAESPEVGLQDVFWALLNAREFVFNH